MPYENIPGIGATYLDGSLRIIRSSGQPRILVLGSADSGVPYSIYQLNRVADGESEFGSASPMFQKVHESLDQGADNVAVMRIGGRRGSLVITDNAGGTLTIYPELRDAEVLDRYALLMSLTDDVVPLQRIKVYDLEGQVYVYDSEEEEVLDTGLVEVLDGGLTLCSTPVAWETDPDSADALSALDTTDFTGKATPEVLFTTGSVVAVDGDDGSAMSLVERYAALEEAYQFLDYQDADILIPCEAYVDSANVVDGATIDFCAGVPTAGATGLASDGLGYLWKFLYRGKPYIYFSDSPTLFSGSTATFDFDGDLTVPGTSVFDVTALLTGPIGEGITVTIGMSGAGSDAAVTVNAGTGIDTWVISVQIGSATTNLTIVTEINAHAGTLVLATVGATPAVAYGASNSGTLALASGCYLTHTDLTGDVIPAAVWTRFYAGVDAELREVNFAHQLAYACYRASTTWSTMIGVISTEETPGYTRAQVAEWIGEEPDYAYAGQDLAIGTAAADGDGVLGIKFHAGAYGYRSHLVPFDTVNDSGYAYGGYILTEGASLPTDEPYGIPIASAGVYGNDEALDAKGEPIDLGKHIFVCSDWPIHSNSYNGGTQYRGPICGTFAGKLTQTPDNQEPIGINGLVRSIRRPPRMRYPQVNSLAKLRFITTRLEEGVGNILVSVRTAAHPDSDYTRLSTIRCVNREISGIRTVARPYIGKEFSSTRLASLEAAISGFLKAEKEGGFNQGAVASLFYTRADRIMGRLTVRLKMIPPFSIEAITIETTLAAEESELAG